MPTIPQRQAGARAAQLAEPPALAPCVLEHQRFEENLSNAARGWFRGMVEFSYSTFLIRNPRGGVILIDPALGANTGADLDQAPFWFRWQFSGAKDARPLEALLKEAGVSPGEVTLVLLTHGHWDHTGGLAQLPKARVLMASAEADWELAQSGALVEGSMPHHFDTVHDRIDRIAFSGPPTDGFPASQDLLGDGSIVAVQTVGHTRGSTSYFVSAGNGSRFLFVGDAAWVKENFVEPATKGRLASHFADWDGEQTASTLGLLHALWASHAAMLVTAHDPRTWDGIPHCAAAAAIK